MLSRKRSVKQAAARTTQPAAVAQVQNASYPQATAQLQDNRSSTLQRVQQLRELNVKEPHQQLSQLKQPNAVLQAVLFEGAPGDWEGWNAMLAHLEELHEEHVLPGKDAIDEFVAAAEIDWYGTEEHSAAVEQFNAKITLKSKMKSALEELKVPPTDSADLDWDEIVGYLAAEIHAKGFITVESEHRHLPGGHGLGYYWAASDGTTGTVPDNAHGRGEGALNGARGSVRTVIIAHNAAVDAAKAAVDNL